MNNAQLQVIIQTEKKPGVDVFLYSELARIVTINYKETASNIEINMTF